MTRLSDVATVIRSKNAGPFVITFDIFLPTVELYESARRVVTPERLASAFGISVDEIMSFIHFDLVRAIKFSIQRKHSSGAPMDRDVYGAQQYAPLLNLRLDE